MESTLGRRHRRTRREILDAAAALSATAGIDGWTMRQLADEVDYTPGALYRYFDSKAALLAALTDEAMRELHVRLSQAATDGSPVDRIAALFGEYLAYAHDEPSRFALLFVHLPSRRVALGQSPSADSPYRVLLDAVEHAVAVGSLAVTDDFGPEQIAYTVWATAHGMAVLESTHLRGFDADFDAVHREAIDRLLTALAHSPRHRATED